MSATTSSAFTQAISGSPARRVSGSLACAAATTPLHVSVLPRRGSLVRRRTPAVRGVPASELNAYRAAWAKGLGVKVPTAAEMNQLHSERIGEAPIAGVSTGCGGRTCLTAPSCCSRHLPHRHRRTPHREDARGTSRPHAAPDPWHGGRSHPTLNHRRTACRVSCSNRRGRPWLAVDTAAAMAAIPRVRESRRGARAARQAAANASSSSARGTATRATAMS